MRAARLLRIMLLLQNRGRLTSTQLAQDLEVTPRTILRDVDAMTEAGLPIIVHQGNRGGIELGFNYRTRLTGLAQEEADALGLILAAENPMTQPLGLGKAAQAARTKLIESFPDRTRERVSQMMARFIIVADDPIDDPRIRALALAVRKEAAVRLRFGSSMEQLIHPIAMEMRGKTWSVHDDLSNASIEIGLWGRVNISAIRFSTVQVFDS
jgi:predicted DNA-binding transcriptional regulator YafY